MNRFIKFLGILLTSFVILGSISYQIFDKKLEENARYQVLLIDNEIENDFFYHQLMELDAQYEQLYVSTASFNAFTDNSPNEKLKKESIPNVIILKHKSSKSAGEIILRTNNRDGALTFIKELQLN